MPRGGHNKKSTYLKVLQGTLRKDRTNPKAPKLVRSIPSPSRGLVVEAKREFMKLAAILDEMGILSKADSGELENLALVRVQIKYAQKKLFKQTETKEFRKWQLILNDAIKISNALSMKFGLNPADRDRVSTIRKPKEPNPWANL